MQELAAQRTDNTSCGILEEGQAADEQKGMKTSL
jgi:hypothetical protein